MIDAPLAAADFLVHPLHLDPLRLGPLRATPYGLCAAAGLLLAMALVRRSAPRAGMDPEAAWDAGMCAILGCFFASRLLLVLHDPLAFTRYPLLVLGLPSLTYGGMAVAALLLAAYLRRKRIPLRPLLDSFAPPAALLAACLEIGHALDGSEVGMPSTLPWAVGLSSSKDAVRVHPVAIYGALLALLLTLTLWNAIGRTHAAGRVAAGGLMLGGATAFGLDMLTQPVFTTLNVPVEPGQGLALAAIAAGGLLWTFAPSRYADPTHKQAFSPTHHHHLPGTHTFAPEVR